MNLPVLDALFFVSLTRPALFTFEMFFLSGLQSLLLPARILLATGAGGGRGVCFVIIAQAQAQAGCKWKLFSCSRVLVFFSSLLIVVIYWTINEEFLRSHGLRCVGFNEAEVQWLYGCAMSNLWVMCVFTQCSTKRGARRCCRGLLAKFMWFSLFFDSTRHHTFTIYNQSLTVNCGTWQNETCTPRNETSTTFKKTTNAKSEGDNKQ